MQSDSDGKKHSGRCEVIDGLNSESDACPTCGQLLVGTEIRGPGDRRAVPCGHRIGVSNCE